MAFDRFPILYESLAKGPEMSVTAKKMPTRLVTTLGRTVDSTWESLQGKEVPTGTVVEIAGTLYWVDATGGLNKAEGGRTINIYHRVGTGAYSVVKTVTTDAASNFKTTYTLAEIGIHTFYGEFPGDDKYEGCAQKAFSMIKAR
jgi:hypothetical protein